MNSPVMPSDQTAVPLLDAVSRVPSRYVSISIGLRYPGLPVKVSEYIW